MSRVFANEFFQGETDTGYTSKKTIAVQGYLSFIDYSVYKPTKPTNISSSYYRYRYAGGVPLFPYGNVIISPALSMNGIYGGFLPKPVGPSRNTGDNKYGTQYIWQI